MDTDKKEAIQPTFDHMLAGKNSKPANPPQPLPMKGGDIEVKTSCGKSPQPSKKNREQKLIKPSNPLPAINSYCSRPHAEWAEWRK